MSVARNDVVRCCTRRERCSADALFSSLALEQQDVFGVLGAGKMEDCFVHCDQNQTASQGETEQVGTGDLLGAVQPCKERAA